MTIDKAVGNRIAEERERLQLTQREVGERIGLTTTQVGKIEIGLKKVNISILALLYENLGMSIDYIVTGKRNPSNSVNKLKEELLEKESELNELRKDVIALFKELKSREESGKDSVKNTA